MRLMTPEQTLSKNLIEHPRLYAYKDKESAKFAIYDQMFNVIGSGFGNVEDFVDNLDVTQKDEKIINYDVSPFFESAEPLLFTYSEHDPKFKSMGFDVGLSESFLGLMTEEEAGFRTDIVASEKGVGKNMLKTPYPNFSKSYSILYKKDDLSFLSDEWLKEIKWFYKECKNFFKSDGVYDYPYYFPREEETRKWENIINDYEKGFERMKEPNDTTYSHYKRISDVYKLEYTGDTKNFIKECGSRKVQEALDFINETIEKIDSELSLRQSKKSKRKL